MRNAYFTIDIDEQTGYITTLSLPDDPHAMNWCAAGGHWGRLHSRNSTLVSCTVSEDHSESVYDAVGLSVRFVRTFAENGNFVETCTLTNTTDTVLCVNRDNFSIEFPWNDRYTNADECMVRHCHTHIWCGHDTAWINALRMGDSDQNLGLYLTEGAFDCYCQDGCKSNDRGIFLLCPTSFFLCRGESYTLRWEIFRHKGKDDFFRILSTYDRYIHVTADRYTLFLGEETNLTVQSHGIPTLTCQEITLPVTKVGDEYHAVYAPTLPGVYRIQVQCGANVTYTELTVKLPFWTLLENRVRFIVQHGQCLDEGSPLYGAFLVYDNDYDSLYFDFKNPDHNACRERLNIPLLLLKYLQVQPALPFYDEVRTAMDRFLAFVFREFYDAETGEVFNTIGKCRDQLRLYNAPGVMLLFAETYFVTHEESYLDHILRLAENYYGIGGKKCYANGLAIGKVMRAFREAGRTDDGERILALFHTHVDNIIGNGTSYPKHEVNYEQTIVTPAVTHIAEMGMLCPTHADYPTEARRHLACLARFSGEQPSCYLNEIAIRYWDDYWFGKNRTFGDTLPHHLSCLTARAYIAYAKLTGETEWLARAKTCIRNCMCLIGDDGRGAAAHVYPYRLDGRRGEFFDPWSNDQDLVLYDALYLLDVDAHAF